ncbi:MAG: hypothetical protein EWM73_03046 [Nitrospira sp.]|nr:MAG: hypothetical protein EWM73_03046 [Nitrospira sp.]
MVGLEVALGFERGHAARARGGHGLAVGEVGDVAGREDAGHGGLRAPRRDLDVFVRVQVDLPLEDGRIGLVPDGDEEPVNGRLPLDARLEVLEPHRRHLALGGVQDVLDRRVPDELDLGVLQRTLLHDLGGAERIAAMDHLHLAAEAREVERLLHGGVAAADDHDVLVLEEEAVAGGAGADAAPHELGLVGQADELGRGPSAAGAEQPALPYVTM